MKSERYHIDRDPALFQRIEHLAKGRRAFCLTDERVFRECYPILEAALAEKLDLVPIRIPEGEAEKTLGNCERIWRELMAEGAERDSLLIALGGGVITDIGGFVAACYKRGMPIVRLPTTLLAMVDAAIGGKNGVDLDGYKNMVGTIREPRALLIHPPFLKSLDERQRRAGYAEMFKHGLLEGPELFRELKALDLKDLEAVERLLPSCIEVKQRIVTRDPYEEGEREKLNFGHTIGHALESLSFESKTPLLHGEAVAAGMIVEAFVSEEEAGLPKAESEELSAALFARFGKVELPDEGRILEAMEKDKKRRDGITRMVLLEGIGKARPGYAVSSEILKKAFERYRASE